MRVFNNLRSAEVHQMCVLLGDVLAAFHSGESGDVLQQLPERLASFFSARTCMIGEVERRPGQGGLTWSRVGEFGWSGHDQRHAMISSFESAETLDPVLVAAIAQEGDCVTRTRRELVPDHAWFQSRHYLEHRVLTGLDDALVSICTTRPREGCVGVIALHRTHGDRPFDESEASLLEVLHRQLAPFMWASELLPAVTLGPGPDIGVKPCLPDCGLTPAQLRVVPYLLQGYREEEIATLLCRSRHTIHDHVMAVYRAFGVHSRADLIVKLSNGHGAAAVIAGWRTLVPPDEVPPLSDRIV